MAPSVFIRGRTDNKSTYGECLPCTNFQQVGMLDVRLESPGVYVLDLDFIEPGTRQRIIGGYQGAYFKVKVGVKNAQKVLNLVPGVHTVLADSLEVTACGPPVGMFLANWLAIASAGPSEAPIQWTEV